MGAHPIDPVLASKLEEHAEERGPKVQILVAIKVRHTRDECLDALDLEAELERELGGVNATGSQEGGKRGHVEFTVGADERGHP
jgi:hypothetical protein